MSQHPITSANHAAQSIIDLINSRPTSPRLDELEAIIAKAVMLVSSRASPEIPALSPEHHAYRKLVAEIERYNEPGYIADNEETEAAFSRLQEQACELETQIWAKPAKTLADLLLRAEIALFNENGVMDYLGDNAAYYDDRAQAQLIQAVLDVLGGRNAL